MTVIPSPRWRSACNGCHQMQQQRRRLSLAVDILGGNPNEQRLTSRVSDIGSARACTTSAAANAAVLMSHRRGVELLSDNSHTHSFCGKGNLSRKPCLLGLPGSNDLHLGVTLPSTRATSLAFSVRSTSAGAATSTSRFQQRQLLCSTQHQRQQFSVSGSVSAKKFFQLFSVSSSA